MYLLVKDTVAVRYAKRQIERLQDRHTDTNAMNEKKEFKIIQV